MPNAIMRLANGTTIPLVMEQDGEAWEIRHRNPGLPDTWNSGNWTPGAPLMFDAVEATVPGCTMLAAAMQGAQILPNDQFILVRPSDYKYKANRNGVPIFNPSLYDMTAHHALLPGDTLYWRFPPVDDPWELRMLSAITPEQKAAALAVLDFDEEIIARQPWAQKALGWYKYDFSSMTTSTPAGQRNMGFLLNPWGFMTRWPNNPVPLAGIAHWYGLGSKMPGGEGLANEHYADDAAWIGQGLRTNDPAALTIGLYLLRQKIAYGLIDCDQYCWHRGKWRTEKSDTCRGTVGMVPSWAKEYDKGLAAAAALLPNSPFIQRAMTVRKNYLLNAGNEWQGSGGARNIGHFWDNLYQMYKATGDEAFKNKATASITWAFGPGGPINSNPNYIQDSPAPGATVSVGEGTIALSAARIWVFREGVRPDLKPQLDSMLDWSMSHGVHTNGRIGYFWSPTTGLNFSGHFQGAFGAWLRMRHEAPQHAAKFALIENYMFTVYANNNQVDACYAGEGPGWSKAVPAIAIFGLTRG